MSFAHNLKIIMQEKNLSQTDLSILTGIGKSSLSQYLSGKNTPSRGRIAKMASALGISIGRLTVNLPVASTESPPIACGQKISVNEAAQRLGKSPQFVRVALQTGAAPFGFATKVSGDQYDYHISPKLLGEYIGEKADFTGENTCAGCHQRAIL